LSRDRLEPRNSGPVRDRDSGLIRDRDSGLVRDRDLVRDSGSVRDRERLDKPSMQSRLGGREGDSPDVRDRSRPGKLVRFVNRNCFNLKLEYSNQQELSE
jgi:hypothetical protein